MIFIAYKRYLLRIRAVFELCLRKFYYYFALILKLNSLINESVFYAFCPKIMNIRPCRIRKLVLSCRTNNVDRYRL